MYKNWIGLLGELRVAFSPILPFAPFPQSITLVMRDVERDVQVLDWTLGAVESGWGWTGNKNKFPKTFAS